MALTKLGATELDAVRNAQPQTPTTLPGDTDASAEKPPRQVRGVPIERIGNTFETYHFRDGNAEMRVAFDAAKAVAAGTRAHLVLGGTPGNGRTHLAIAAMNAWHNGGIEGAIFWKVADWLSWLKRVVMVEHYDVDYATDGYRNGAMLLVFDDLGKEYDTPWTKEQLFRVLDSRYDRRLPTIITTNLDGPALEALDPALADRYGPSAFWCTAPSARPWAVLP